MTNEEREIIVKKITEHIRGIRGTINRMDRDMKNVPDEPSLPGTTGSWLFTVDRTAQSMRAKGYALIAEAECIEGWSNSLRRLL